MGAIFLLAQTTTLAELSNLTSATDAVTTGNGGSDNTHITDNTQVQNGHSFEK